MNGALLLTALFNGAWQGAVLCTLAYLLLRTQRRLNATTMFTVWSVLLAIALALPAANYVFAARPYMIHVHAAAKTAVVSEHGVPLPNSQQRVVRSVPAKPRPEAWNVPPVSDLAVAGITWLLDRAAIVLWIAAAVAGVRVAILMRDLLGMFAARRAARRIDLPVVPRGSIRRPYAFAASGELKSPCVLGFSPALIVIPEELLAAPEKELLSVVLHEREHVRRYDDVQNVLHRLIDAVAFFCPGVRIALRELALYREQICDDAAVNGIGDAVSYAMTLTGMAQWAQGRGVPVPSLIFKRKQLIHRLEVLLDKAVNHSLRINRRFASVSAAAIILASAIVVHVQVPVIAKTIDPAPVPAKPAPPIVVLKAPRALAAVPKPVQTPMPKPVHTPMPVRQPHSAAPVHARTASPASKIAAVTGIAPLAVRVAATAVRVSTIVPRVALNAPAVTYAPASPSRSNDVLDALDAAGIHNLSVDELIAIRDHGVSATLVRAAVSYFGPRLSAGDLVTLADHGVSASYLDALRNERVTGIAPASVVMLMDHGVNAAMIRAANQYFSYTLAPADLVYLSDRGVGARYLASLDAAGVRGIPPADVVRLMDHGVDASYIQKVRRINPRATINDIIRLRDAGF